MQPVTLLLQSVKQSEVTDEESSSGKGHEKEQIIKANTFEIYQMDIFKKQTSPQAKRHKLSLLFTFLTIFTSLTTFTSLNISTAWTIFTSMTIFFDYSIRCNR